MANIKAAALLCGINAYKDSPLSGCVPDIHSVYQFLRDSRGLPHTKMQMLLDAKATRFNIIKGLHWLAASGAETAYFFYSGHGTRVKDLDGDEKRQHSGTTYDQAIVPVNYATRGLILDDEMGELYATFPAKTKIIVHLDSCFSAKSDRGAFSFVSDAYTKYVRGRHPRALSERQIPKTALAATYARREGKGVLPYRQVLLISGCRDFETSADAWFQQIGYRGAMTYFIESAIRDLGHAASYRHVIDAARKKLAASGYPQVPQLEGPDQWLSQPVFT